MVLFNKFNPKVFKKEKINSRTISNKHSCLIVMSAFNNNNDSLELLDLLELLDTLEMI